MLNILWPIFIIISVIYAILTGRISEINQSIFDSTSDAIELSITLLRNSLPVEWNHENRITDQNYKYT